MDQPVRFQFFTHALKAWEDEKGDRFVRGVTSSTVRDLQGDEMTPAALESMRETALDNMTVFLNHQYEVPNHLFGSVTDAAIVKRFDDEEQAEVFDLDIVVKVCPEDENPAAMQTFRAIRRGVKLGLSIGANITKASRKVVDGVETFVIDGVRLLESSVVGIPANQRSYFLGSAVKALQGIPVPPEERPIPLDAEERGLGDKMRATITRNQAAAAARAAKLSSTPPIEPDPTPPDVELPAEETEPADQKSAAPGVEPDVELGWLPEGITQGDLDDGDFAWLSDAYKAGKESKSEGRKLPYKIHGTVHEGGWRAAWSRAHQMKPVDFEGGPSQSAVLKKLLADKPKDIEVADDGKSVAPEATKHGDGFGADDVAGPGVTAATIMAALLDMMAGEDDDNQRATLRELIALLQGYIGNVADELAANPSDTDDGVQDAVLSSAVVSTTRALEAAVSARQEATALVKRVTELEQEKAQIEGQLAKAADLLLAALALPVGRKSVVAPVVRDAASAFPWLEPSIARRLAN